MGDVLNETVFKQSPVFKFHNLIELSVEALINSLSFARGMMEKIKFV
jgi:hypothetical protein